MISLLSGELGAYRSTKQVARWALKQVHEGQPAERAQRLQLYRILHLIRKPAHVLLYGLLALSLCRLLQLTTNLPRRSVWLYVILFCIIVAGLDEWHQTLFPNRTAQVSDVALDGLAAIFALWLQALYQKRLVS